MTYQKAITDAATGETLIVDLTPEEMAEIEAKQSRAGEEAAGLAAVFETVASLPTDDEIRNATKIADLKEIQLRQNAVIALLAERLGLKG